MNIGEKRQSKISFLTACGRRLGWDFRGAGKLEQETRETVSTGGRPKKKRASEHPVVSGLCAFFFTLLSHESCACIFHTRLVIFSVTTSQQQPAFFDQIYPSGPNWQVVYSL